MNLVLTRGREGVQNPEKLEDVICTCSLMPNPSAISAHQWVAVDNPLAAAVVCLSIFPAFLERIIADFYHCFSSPPIRRREDRGKGIYRAQNLRQ